MSSSTHGTAASPFKQPKAVFAVAFACVVSFMGIGLVDPILPAISNQLHASPSETTLLFTSYLVVTAVAMLITNWVSSRIGAKWTLIAGLVLIKKPFDTLVAFTLIVGVWFVVAGIVRFVVALGSPEGRGGNILTAILDLIAGILILAWPDLGLATVAVIIGIVLIMRGALFIVAGWQLHKLSSDPQGGTFVHASA